MRTVIKHVTKRLRRHWPTTRVVWRGDSHYGRVEAMDWAEDNGSDYIFGLAGNAVLNALVADVADNLRFHHATSRKAKLRMFASFMYQATSWRQPRKVVARLECSLQPVAGETGMRQEVSTTSALVNVCSFSYPAGLIGSLVRSPFLSAGFGGLLSSGRSGWRGAILRLPCINREPGEQAAGSRHFHCAPKALAGRQNVARREGPGGRRTDCGLISSAGQVSASRSAAITSDAGWERARAF